MTQSIANMSQVWMSNNNTYTALGMSVSTLGYGANSNSRMFVLKVDGNTKFDVSTTGAVNANTILADTITANNLSSANITNSTGSVVFVNGYSRQPGTVIEILTGFCDGSSVTVGSGTYTLPNVTTYLTMPTSYVDVPGSSITYTPPPGTTKVIYKFDFTWAWNNAGTISHHKFFIDTAEVVWARRNYSSQGAYPEFRSTFDWVIPIGGTSYANTANTGRLTSWTTPKTLKIQGRAYSASYTGIWHATEYWDGAAGVMLSLPILTITAIA